MPEIKIELILKNQSMEFTIFEKEREKNMVLFNRYKKHKGI